jgi:hypothetical protein
MQEKKKKKKKKLQNWRSGNKKKKEKNKGEEEQGGRDKTRADTRQRKRDFRRRIPTRAATVADAAGRYKNPHTGR